MPGRGSNVDEDDLQSYLYFGAVYGDLRTEGLPLLADAPSDRDREWAASASEDQLVREGVRCLREATQEALAQTSESRHAVFLSAGFDSRALLGSLLEHLSADELVTLTFGTPGALDYEIPARVSKDVGVRHERLDATSVSWDVASVTAFARSELSLPAPEIDGEFISYNLWNRFGCGNGLLDRFSRWPPRRLSPARSSELRLGGGRERVSPAEPPGEVRTARRT